MAKISKNKVTKEVENLMWQQMTTILRDTKSQKEVEKILRDLLTPSEKILFGKRLLIALFLSKNWSYVQISQQLKVSSATINSVQNAIRRGGDGYAMMTKITSPKTNNKLGTFLRVISDKVENKLESAVDRLAIAYRLRPRKNGPRWH